MDARAPAACGCAALLLGHARGRAGRASAIPSRRLARASAPVRISALTDANRARERQGQIVQIARDCAGVGDVRCERIARGGRAHNARGNHARSAHARVVDRWTSAIVSRRRCLSLRTSPRTAASARRNIPSSTRARSTADPVCRSSRTRRSRQRRRSPRCRHRSRSRARASRRREPRRPRGSCRAVGSSTPRARRSPRFRPGKSQSSGGKFPTSG